MVDTVARPSRLARNTTEWTSTLKEASSGRGPALGARSRSSPAPPKAQPDGLRDQRQANAVFIDKQYQRRYCVLTIHNRIASKVDCQLFPFAATRGVQRAAA